jgi:hypothetical protein
MNIKTIQDFRRAIRNGPYAWPGGYPLFFLMADGGVISFAAAKAERRQILEAMSGQGWGDMWTPVAFEVNWEDSCLICDHSNARIESAYAEEEAETD